MPCRSLALLESTKANATTKEMSFCLPIGQPPVALLRPVACGAVSENDEDVSILTKGRNRFMGAFLHEFNATTFRTARWLNDSVGPDNSRIVFMIDDVATGATIGYMGLAYIDWESRYGEADSIVRVSDVSKGVMKQSLQTMLAWASDRLELKTLAVRVRSDNPAVHFYERVGFQEHRRVPLSDKKEIDGSTRYFENPASTNGLTLVHMTYHRPS